jgi:hypothetical protein
MRRLLLCSLLVLAGCQNVQGPAQRPPVHVDDPWLSMPEKQRLGRAFVGLPDESYLAGPHTGASRQEDLITNQR